MVRNAALLALVILAASEQAALFPYISPHNMNAKYEPKEEDGFQKFQNNCYNFIYAVVGKGDAKALQNLPGLADRLCRASEEDCKLYTESLLAAVEQKQLQLKLRRVSRPYADWCEEVYNHRHPTTTPTTSTTTSTTTATTTTTSTTSTSTTTTSSSSSTTTTMLLQHHEKLAADQPQKTAAAKAAKARLPLQLKKSAAAPTTTAKPQAQAALPPLQAVKNAARAVAAERARRQAQATTTTTTTLVNKEIIRRDIQDMEKDVGNHEQYFIADMTGHAIASTAPLSMDKAQQLGGAEVAFDKALLAVNKMDTHEHKHHHRHHSSR